MENIIDFKEWFVKNFKTFEDNLNGEKTPELHRIRKEALKNFSDLSLPTLKDEEWRAFVHKLDTLRSENNAKAKQIGMLMGQGKKEEAQAIIKETSQFKEEIKSLEEKEKVLLVNWSKDLIKRFPIR